MTGWEDPATPRYYEAFDTAHDRYRRVNTALVREAGVRPGMRVLDVGAGLGGTAREAIAVGAAVVCFEPAPPMLERGRQLVPGATWVAELPGEQFDRVLCGSSIWLLGPLDDAIPRLSQLGPLAFAVPALYLGETDEPGGGQDPLLLALPAALAEGRVPQADPADPFPSADAIDVLLGAGCRRWTIELLLTQAALRDWLKVPPLTAALFPELSAGARAARVDAAYARCDPVSWRRERWRGWTACY
jgi:SAM-dependent methyltransferase